MVVHAASCPAEFYNRQNDEDIDYLITLSELERIIRYTPAVRSAANAENPYYIEFEGGYAFSVVGNLSAPSSMMASVDHNAVEWYSGVEACIDIPQEKRPGPLRRSPVPRAHGLRKRAASPASISRSPTASSGAACASSSTTATASTCQPSSSACRQSHQPSKIANTSSQGQCPGRALEMDACFKDTDAITLNCGACGYDTCYAKSCRRPRRSHVTCASAISRPGRILRQLRRQQHRQRHPRVRQRLHHPADESVHRENVRPIPHGSRKPPQRLF